MTWKEKLIREFIPDLEPKAWVVSDPDGIVRNEQILGRLHAKGFETLFFDEPLAFRYEYESRIRRAWERGDRTPVIVLFDDRTDGFDALPSDLLLAANRKEFGLAELFPRLDSGVLAQLPPNDWETLNDHAEKHPDKTFWSGETEELALRLCYRLVPEVIDSAAEFVRRLIEVHREGIALPTVLADRLEKMLMDRPEFADWPVRKLAEDSSHFWGFVHERWKRYVTLQADLEKELPPVAIAGPDLPFDDPVLRGYVEASFEEGLLEAVEVSRSGIDGSPWWLIGVKNSDGESGISEKWFERLAGAIPGDDAGYREWVQFGLNYSKAISQIFRSKENHLRERFWDQLWPAVDQRFSQWIRKVYSGLHNLPASPPAMVHHLPKQLLRWVKNDGERVALVVLDGLSCAGWCTLRDGLLDEKRDRVMIEESAVFSWGPSLTPVCRQSLFSGLPPLLFPETLDRTDRDAARWRTFWESNAELLPSQVHHQLVGGQKADFETLFASLGGKVRALGLTVRKPDTIMHGSTLGWPGWHQQLELWNDETKFTSALIERLLDDGFTVCLSADHGNLEAVGTGKINEGVMAENRGQRVRVYPQEPLRDAAFDQHAQACEKFDIGVLPEDFRPLYAKGRGAFVKEGETVVAHGGLSLDELLVPWVVIRNPKQ